MGAGLCVCVELECQTVAWPGSNEENMIFKIFTAMGSVPAPGGSPWMSLSRIPKHTQLVKAMGRKKAMTKCPWTVKEQCQEFLQQMLTPCPSLRCCAKDALTLPYLLAAAAGDR